jgi:2-keto-4-pentenoate hydratase/2-oxohepta-3-ene-1,7-dioic acid hydratase in catechol pathway
MKIFCVGRNYVEHAKELNNEVPESPVIFMKPPTALLQNGAPLYYPEFTKDLHYEGELVVKICKNGKKIAPRFAHKYYEEVSLGFDFTARDLQSKLKAKGLPWELAKSFDGAAALGSFVHKDIAMDADGQFHFTFEKNGTIVQRGNTGMMIFSIDTIISFLSQYFTLQRGDLIYTGTPAGVGPVVEGDHLTGRFFKEEILSISIL